MPHIVDFRKPETAEELSLYLGITHQLLDAAISAGESPEASPDVYICHSIPKRNKARDGYRVVWEVMDPEIRDGHKAFARRFCDFLNNVVGRYPHNAAYGYVRGRGIKDNAERHCGQPILIRCDIKDFFPTITKNRLISHFKRLGIHQDVAATLSAFATINGKLALGLNASPTIANLVCLDLDERLEQLAHGHKCVYTRYADDITISGDQMPPQVSLIDIIESEGFKVSMPKMRITKRGQAHFVTGLSVADPDSPHVPRKYKHRLRQELYYCEKFGINGHLDHISAESYQRGLNRIDGTVRFVAGIETQLGPRLREQWRRTLESNSARVSYAPVHDVAGTEVFLLFDEALFKRDGKEYLALACVATGQINLLRRATLELLREYLIDPFSPGRKERLSKKGLHFTDAPRDLKSQYIDLLSYLPFRTYIAFAQLRDDYKTLYAALLGSILPRRLMAYDRSTLTLAFEQNPQVPKSMLEGLVNFAYSDLEQTNNRRPLMLPQIVVCSKQDEPAISIPDSLLGIFCGYFSPNDNRDSPHLRFERVRDKYRHIVDIDTGENFSRRHPLEVLRYGST